MRKLCLAQKKDGSPCSASPVEDSDFCFLHDPDRKEDAAKAREKGVKKAQAIKAEQKNLPEGSLPTFKLNNLNDVKRLLAQVINDFRMGKISASDAKTTAYVANILVSTIKDGDMEKQLNRLEEMIKERGVGHARQY